MQVFARRSTTTHIFHFRPRLAAAVALALAAMGAFALIDGTQKVQPGSSTRRVQPGTGATPVQPGVTPNRVQPGTLPGTLRPRPRPSLAVRG
jgi:hypothetical protein